MLERAAAIVAVQRKADERESKLWDELTAKDRQLRSEIRSRAEAQAELSTLQAELATVTAERRRLVDEFAAKDRQFAAEIAEYRKQVASIAGSPDPRKRAALQRYAEGDRAGGFGALVEIQRAETKAVAAGWREIGALALDRKDRGEMTTAEVLPIYEEAQRLDPDDAWGWVALRRLYQEAGRLPDARRAAQEALNRAQGDRDRSVASTELGDVEAARRRFQQSLSVRPWPKPTPAAPPPGATSLDLVGWRGSPRDPRFQDVVSAVKAMIAGEPRPRPRAPGRRKRIAAALATSGTMLAAIVGFIGDVAGLQGALCRVPGVRAACGAVGLGGIPTKAEEALWMSRPAGDCEILRTISSNFPRVPTPRRPSGGCKQSQGRARRAGCPGSGACR